MEGSVPVAGQGLYAQPRAAGQELASFKVSSLWIDFDVHQGLFNETTGTAGSLGGGVPFDIHGDWIYVDPSSVGAAQADLAASNDDSQTFALVPGVVIKQRFDRIRVYSPLSSYTYQVFTNQGNLANCGIRLFYGTGKCPFEPTQLPLGGVSPVAYGNLTAAVQTAAILTITGVPVPSGAWIEASINASQLTIAGETSILVPYLQIQFPVNSIYIAPDAVSQVSVQPAAVGHSSVSGRWRLRAPRGAFSTYLSVANIGTATTNNIQFQTAEYRLS